MTTQLNYTGLDNASILKAIQDRCAADPRFRNFSETAIAQLVFEIFSATTEFSNFYIERTSEESFFETAKRRSSAILLSRNLVYDITRPIPAEVSIKLTLTGSFSGIIFPGMKIQIPIYSNFIYGNLNFLLKNGFTYTFTETDWKTANSDGEDFILIIDKDDNGDEITLIQGTVKTKVIPGTTNPQIGQLFQKYRINDVTFSNNYGSSDFTDSPITKIWVGDTMSDANLFVIDRKSIINPDTILGAINGEIVKCCVVRTSLYEDVDILFGDAKISELGADINTSGPNTSFDNIYIQYLSTLGSKANLVGISGERVAYSSSILIGTQNVSSKIDFKLNSNITGGADLEDSDSIKINAPALFYTMDRLVNGIDYSNYLRTLTSPIRVKNAISWGEQEEIELRDVAAIAELANVILFSCVGALYNVNDDANTTETFSVRTEGNRLEESILDADIDEEGLNYQCYFNVYSKNAIARQLKEYETTDSYWEIIDYTPILDLSYSDIKATYPGSNSLSADIESEKYLSGTNELKSFTFTMSAITSMDGAATVLQNSLAGILDTRSLVVSGVETNANYGLAAFPNISVEWDSENLKFKIHTGINDPCYPKYIIAGSNLATDLGLHDVASDTTNSETQLIYINKNYNLVSKKIVTVVDLLKKKSQITSKHIYVSPMLQNFSFSGDVYVEQLFDKNELQRVINNKIYNFLNKNINYNTPVYESNIIDIIEDYAGISHVNAKLIPKSSIPPTGQGTHFYPIIGRYTPTSVYGNESVILTSIINSINSYFNLTGTIYQLNLNGSSAATKWNNFITYVKSLTSDQIHDDVTYGLSGLNEREFITGFVTIAYDNLSLLLGGSNNFAQTLTKFQDRIDFLTVMSDIHKDINYAIKMNMLDINGNISPSYNIIENDFGIDSKVYDRGGYSLGSEIAKIEINLNYQYK